MAEINRYATGLFDGSASAPALSFAGLTTAGLYRSGNHMYVVTPGNVRINSRDFTDTSGTIIGFQSKPAATANTASITGFEVSPRVNSGVTLSGNIIGGHVDAYLKGTAAGTITGAVRGLQVELVTDDAGTRTISGDVSMIRLRSAFSATTISGKFCAIRIEKPETQTNSKTFDAVFELPSTLTGVWHDTQTSATGAGFIKCLINGNARYITLTSGAPS